MADSEKTATQSVDPSLVAEKKQPVENVVPATTTLTHAAEPAAFDEKPASKRDSTASSEEDDDNFEYPTKWKLTAITLALCLSVFCMALDNTIVKKSPLYHCM